MLTKCNQYPVSQCFRLKRPNHQRSIYTRSRQQTASNLIEIRSLIPLAKNLEGRLVLVHGMEDSNVLFQDTIAVYSELLKQGKEAIVELFLDPTGGDGMGGLVKTVNRYNKYEDYFLRHLGKGEPAQPEVEETAEDTEDQEQDEPDFPGV